MNTNKLMFNKTDFLIERLCGLSVGGYSIGKIISLASIKDTWHFQVLQEMAFAAAIISCGVAIATYMKKKRKK